MPGYAVYQTGKLLDSGTLVINPDTTIPERLQQLVHGLRKLYRQWDPDVLVYEQIPVQAYGNRDASGHASLLKSVGAILSVSGPQLFVGLPPTSWKKLARDTYTKGDREDAEEMGWIAIEQARSIPPRKTRGYGKKEKKASGM